TLARITSDRLQHYHVFTVGIDSSCTEPAAPLLIQGKVCNGGLTLLGASSTGTLRWFSSMQDEVPFAVGNNILQTGVTGDTTFYVEARTIGCLSSRVAYPVKWFNNPSAPTVSGNTNLCYAQGTLLSASGPNIANWYSEEDGTIPVFTGTSFQTDFLTADTMYFVESVENGCPGSRTRVPVQVRAEVAKPFTTSIRVCEGNPATV